MLAKVEALLDTSRHIGVLPVDGGEVLSQGQVMKRRRRLDPDVEQFVEQQVPVVASLQVLKVSRRRRLRS